MATVLAFLAPVGVVSIDATAADTVGFVAPAAHGVVDLGDPVHYDLGASGCAHVRVHAELVSESLIVKGPSVVGCSGTVWVPSVGKAADAGYAEGNPASLALVAGETRLELRLMRREFDHTTPWAGTPSLARSDDPRETAGLDAMVLEMRSGDIVEFAATDLRSIHSVAIRSAVPVDEEAAVWELRADDPISGLLVAAGDLGYVGKAPANGGSYPNPWYTLTFRAPPIAPATGKLPTGARPLYFHLVAAPSAVRLNWIDFNGTGVRDPSVSRSSPDPRSSDVLFDAGSGRDFEGWKQCGWTIPRDEEGRPQGMRADFVSASPSTASAVNCPTGPMATYVGGPDGVPAGFFQNVRLRLRYRFEQFEDNGGVVLSGQEFQMHDRGEWFTGGYWSALTCSDQFPLSYIAARRGLRAPQTDCGYPADRIKTYTFPDWSEMEVIQNGPDYLVRINGRDVTRYHRPANAGATPNVITGNSLVLSNFFATSNTIAAPTELDHVWYDDIRVYHCAGPVDAASGKSPDQLCATDTLLPQYPSP